MPDLACDRKAYLRVSKPLQNYLYWCRPCQKCRNEHTRNPLRYRGWCGIRICAMDALRIFCRKNCFFVKQFPCFQIETKSVKLFAVFCCRCHPDLIAKNHRRWPAQSFNRNFPFDICRVGQCNGAVLTFAWPSMFEPLKCVQLLSVWENKLETENKNYG